MANKKHMSILRGGRRDWNDWRNQNPKIVPNLKDADLSGKMLTGINFSGSNMAGVNLRGAILMKSNLSHVNLTGADLSNAVLVEGDLSYATLKGTRLRHAIMERAQFYRAKLNNADLERAEAYGAKFHRATLKECRLFFARLIRADLSYANLSAANMRSANLYKANLSHANLKEADLTGAALVKTNVQKANLSHCRVYGISAWDLEGQASNQNDLIVTPDGEPKVVVDNIKVAQFIYLILNNKEIRDVIDTLTAKSVLILGRFAIPKRKKILDALKERLRGFGFLPIVFDFDRPRDKDFTETIKTLAGLSYFVIADITNPRSSPLELQATIPDYQVPFVPIIEKGEEPFPMMADLQKKYNWVLKAKRYSSMDKLMKELKPKIIDPATKLHRQLKRVKAKELAIEDL